MAKTPQTANYSEVEIDYFDSNDIPIEVVPPKDEVQSPQKTLYKVPQLALEDISIEDISTTIKKKLLLEANSLLTAFSGNLSVREISQLTKTIATIESTLPKDTNTDGTTGIIQDLIDEYDTKGDSEEAIIDSEEDILNG